MTKSDIEILAKMENLIGMNEKLLFGSSGGYNELSDTSHSDFIMFMALIQREVEHYEITKKYANEWNKAHPEKHREQARESYHRVKEKKCKKN